MESHWLYYLSLSAKVSFQCMAFRLDSDYFYQLFQLMNVKLYSFARLGMIHFIRLLPVEAHRLVLQANGLSTRENLPSCKYLGRRKTPCLMNPLTTSCCNSYWY